MKLIHLTLDQLSPSRVNVRKKGGKEIADLLPSIRRLGILQPLLVRAGADGYEVVAGQRRLAALTALAAEGIADPVPVIVMQDGDDATAIEASLTENIARLPMDEIDQYKAFCSAPTCATGGHRTRCSSISCATSRRSTPWCGKWPET